MRSIVIDTETTGLDPNESHRIIELAAVELVDRRPTGRSVHMHLDPEREVETGATEVHGMTWDDLKGKPRFAEVAREFAEFARGAEWIIHNAPFDVGFLDAEFARAEMPCCAELAGRITDTLALAREAFPGKRNSLDALCERFGVDHAHRTLHGALLDARLLADVWLAMTRGQESLTIEAIVPDPRRSPVGAEQVAGPERRAPLRIVQPSPTELAAHIEYLQILDRESKGRCLWLAA